MDRRRQVPERDQRLSRGIVDPDEDGEEIQGIHIEQRCPEVVGDERDNRDEGASVEGELLRLPPPGVLPPLAPHERCGHPRLRDGPDDLLDVRDGGVVGDARLPGDGGDLVASDPGERVQLAGEEVGVAGAVHALNLKCYRFQAGRIRREGGRHALARTAGRCGWFRRRAAGRGFRRRTAGRPRTPIGRGHDRGRDQRLRQLLVLVVADHHRPTAAGCVDDVAAGRAVRDRGRSADQHLDRGAVDQDLVRTSDLPGWQLHLAQLEGDPPGCEHGTHRLDRGPDVCARAAAALAGLTLDGRAAPFYDERGHALSIASSTARITVSIS